MKDAEIVPAGDWKLARQSREVAGMETLSIDQLVAQVSLIQHAMKTVMKEEEHYGKIPGVKKPSLWKSGAEKLCLLFRMDPQYESSETWDGKHLTVKSRCTLYHIPTGQRLGSGEGSCSTKESKYAYRDSKRACPRCGVEAINRSKFPPRGAPKNAEPGWYCYAKQGGCGAEFAAQEPEILTQQTGRGENPDIADQYNTVLKMSNKRAHVAAVLNVTAASDLFTQDLEELREYQPSVPDPEPAKRYTEDELKRARERDAQAPPREKPKSDDPPEAGFSEIPGVSTELPDGPPVGQKEIKTFWGGVDKRAKELGLGLDGKERLGRKLLADFGITSSANIGKNIYNELILSIARIEREDLDGNEAAAQ